MQFSTAYNQLRELAAQHADNQAEWIKYATYAYLFHDLLMDPQSEFGVDQQRALYRAEGLVWPEVT